LRIKNGCGFMACFAGNLAFAAGKEERRELASANA
jgi:hypothetical protein